MQSMESSVRFSGCSTHDDGCVVNESIAMGDIWVLYSHLPKREIVEAVNFLVEAVTTCR